jgi:hypothetical protein
MVDKNTRREYKIDKGTLSVNFHLMANPRFNLYPTRKGDFFMSNCERCKLRARYDGNPASILGRFWKWHIKWCPGWRGYLKSLTEDEKKKIQDKYK